MATSTFSAKTDMTALTGADIAKLTTADLGQLNKTQAALLTADQLSGLSATTLPAITGVFKYIPATELSGIDLKAITGLTLKSLTNDQFKALSVEQLGALSSTQVASLSKVQLGLLDGKADAVAALNIAGVSHVNLDNLVNDLSVEQIAKLSSTQISGLSPLQIGSLTSDQAAALTPAQAPFFKSLATMSIASNNEALQNIAAKFIAALPAKVFSSLSTTQLEALSDTQAAVLNSSQIQSLTADKIAHLGHLGANVAVLSTSAIAGLTKNNINAFDFRLLSGDGQFAALTSIQLGALSNNQIEAISADQAGSLTSAQLSAISATQVVHLSNDAIAAIQPKVISALSPKAISVLGTGSTLLGEVSALTSEQTPYLTSAQIKALSLNQLAKFTADEISVLSPATLAAIPSNVVSAIAPDVFSSLTTAQVAVLTPAQFTNLSATTNGQLAHLTADQAIAITSAQVKGLNGASVSAFMSDTLLALKPATLAAISSTAIGSISAATFSALTSTQIAALKPAQFGELDHTAITGQLAKLGSDQAVGITSAQIKKLDANDIAALTSEAIAALSPATLAAVEPSTFSQLSAEAFGSLTSKHIAALTPAQCNQLTNGQIIQFGADQAAGLTTAQFAKIQPAIVAAMPSEAFSALKPSIIQSLDFTNFTNTQVSYLSPEQGAALTSKQINLLDASDLAGLDADTLVTIKPDSLKGLKGSLVGANGNETAAINGLSVNALSAITTAQLAALSTAQLESLQASKIQYLSDNAIAWLNGKGHTTITNSGQTSGIRTSTTANSSDTASVITAGKKAVNINGSSHADSITGSPYNDTITGGGGSDSIDAGTGNDLITFVNSSIKIDGTIDGGDGIDKLILTNPSNDISGTFPDIPLTDTDFASVTNIEVLQLSGRNVISLGANAFNAGIQKVITGNDKTAITSSYDLTIDGTGIGWNMLYVWGTGNITAKVGDICHSINGDASSGNLTLTGGKQTIWLNGGSGNDIVNAAASILPTSIYGGGGTDTLIGSNVADTFTFIPTASVIGTSLDTITNYVSDTDSLQFTNADGSAVSIALPSVDTSATVAGSNVQVNNVGLITFNSADSTYSKKVTAIQADEGLNAAGQVALFTSGADSYVYYSGASTSDSDDQIIKLAKTVGTGLGLGAQGTITSIKASIDTSISQYTTVETAGSYTLLKDNSALYKYFAKDPNTNTIIAIKDIGGIVWNSGPIIAVDTYQGQKAVVFGVGGGSSVDSYHVWLCDNTWTKVSSVNISPAEVQTQFGISLPAAVIPVVPVGNLTTIESAGSFTLVKDNLDVYFAKATGSNTTVVIKDIGGRIWNGGPIIAVDTYQGQKAVVFGIGGGSGADSYHVWLCDDTWTKVSSVNISPAEVESQFGIYFANMVDVWRPSFTNATVNGNTLVMYYTDANSLSTTTAPTTAFSVSNGGIANPVTSVSVNPTAKTVSLTLTNAVSVGQNVTLSYADPTSNNDANAIQDLAGNDALSITNQNVVNNTFNPVTPTGNLSTIESSGAYTLLKDSAGVYFAQATGSNVTSAIRDIGGGVWAGGPIIAVDTYQGQKAVVFGIGGGSSSNSYHVWLCDDTWTKVSAVNILPTEVESLFGIPLSSYTGSIFTGTSGIDNFVGTSGSDMMTGFNGDDILAGGNGNDTLDGGAGNDVLDGGNGDDKYIMEEVIGGNDVITDSSGSDELVLANTNLELNGHGDVDVNRTGVNNADLSISFYQHGVLKSSTTIIGQFATNTPVIEKFSNENDQRSLVFNNSLVGAAGNDFIVGSSNYDSLTGNAGDDYLFGGAGNDTLDGGDNDDTLFGELGDDSLVGGAGNDMLYAGYGNDTLVGGQGDDEYNLYPQKGSSSQGSSTIIENQNEGNDTIYISDAYSVDMTTSDDGKDLIISAILNGTLVGANTVKDQYKNNAPLIENYSLWLDGSDQTWQFIKGNTGTNANELIVGASVSDTLNGKDGSDWLFGGAGSDTIIGGVGNDTLTGGEGNDTFIFNVGDSVLLGINNPSNIIDVITDLNVGDKIDLSTIATSNNLNLITSGILAADFSGISDTTTNKIDVFFANLNQHFYLVYETTAGNDNTQGSLGVIDIGMSIVGSISNYTELNGIISFQSFTLT